jgi:hypothetical protein
MFTTDMKRNIMVSSVGAVTAELLTIPVCTIRTNYQTKIDNSLSTWGYIKNIYARGGIKSFYNASWASSCSQVGSLAIKYTAYENIKYIRNKNKTEIKHEFLNNCVNSVASSWIASVFHHPFDVTKIHIQRGDKIMDQIKIDGWFKTLSAGYSKTLVRNTCVSIIFPLHDMYKKLLTQYDFESTSKTILAPILTSATSTLTLYPLEYVRNRQMVGLSWRHGYDFKCYYRGVSLALVRNITHFSTFIITAEWIKHKLFE